MFNLARTPVRPRYRLSKPWTESNGRQRADFNLFVYLFAANEQIIRKFGDGDSIVPGCD